MTAENNGVPEDDDPFAYLYRSDGDGGGSGPEAPTQQHNVPRTSYAQATQVGRTQYGQQRHQGQPGSGYGYPQQQPPQQQPPQPQGAPAQPVPGQRYTPPPGGGRAAARGGGGGGNRGVAIGAVAVVLAVVIGISVAMFSSDGKPQATSGGTATPTATQAQTAAASAGASASAALPGVADADTMQVSGAQVMGDHTGAKSKDGKFVATMRPGASITWTVSVPAAGQYQLWIRYANAGGDTSATVSTNGGSGRSIKLPNYTPNQHDWSQAWFYYWTIVDLKAGSNTVVLSSSAGQGNYNVDQLALTDPCNSSSCKPSAW